MQDIRRWLTLEKYGEVEVGQARPAASWYITSNVSAIPKQCQREREEWSGYQQ